MDKPIAHTLEDAIAIVEEEQRANSPILMGFTRPYEYPWRKAYELVRDGVIEGITDYGRKRFTIDCKTENFGSGHFGADLEPARELRRFADGAPMTLIFRGGRIAGWGMEAGSAQEVPVSPVRSDEKEEYPRLIPYGCTNLRITEFPVLVE